MINPQREQHAIIIKYRYIVHTVHTEHTLCGRLVLQWWLSGKHKAVTTTITTATTPAVTTTTTTNTNTNTNTILLII